MNQLPRLESYEDMVSLIEEIGLLPFFKSAIPGFSVQECTPPEYWFSPDEEGPWEWREEVAARGEIVYGKLFAKKAGFVSMRFYPDLLNYRRDGYDFDARYEDGLSPHSNKVIHDLLAHNSPMLAPDIKRRGGFAKDGLKGFDAAMTALQMQAYILPREFVYNISQSGQRYGWGIGQYMLVEDSIGRDVVAAAYRTPPGESAQRLTAHLAGLFPQATQKQLSAIIG